jgi:thiol-disulfide isomerase/thioredoxin
MIRLFALKSIAICILVIGATFAQAQDTLRIAPAFTLSDIHGNKVSLSDFKGKVVYLDFWASWCGPCVAEIPHSKKLQKQFKDNTGIVFINISLDRDTIQWKKKVESKSMMGVQLLSPKGLESDVINNYDLKSIPRFIIINRQGKIVDYDAKRPSQKVDEDLARILAQ